jgi:hypothetical protein
MLTEYALCLAYGFGFGVGICASIGWFIVLWKSLFGFFRWVDHGSKEE